MIMSLEFQSSFKLETYDIVGYLNATYSGSGLKYMSDSIHL